LQVTARSVQLFLDVPAKKEPHFFLLEPRFLWIPENSGDYCRNAQPRLDALTNAIAQSFSVPSEAPTCSLINVAHDFDCATDMLIQAQERDDSAAIVFYKAIRQQCISVQARIVSGNAQLDG